MRNVLLVGLCALTLGCTIEVVADNVQGTFSKSLTVEGPVALEVKSRSGSVEVTGSDGDAVEVVGKIRAGWGEERLSAPEVARRLEGAGG